MLGCAVSECVRGIGRLGCGCWAVSSTKRHVLRRPPPACPLLLLPQKSSNVLLTAGGAAKLADVAFSRELQGTFLSDLPLVGTFAW